MSALTPDPVAPPLTCKFRLNGLCSFIDVHPNVANAEIVETQTYVQRKLFAPHRCLVVEICGGARDHIWLRLDRGPTSASDLSIGFSKTYSNDQVSGSLESHKEILTNETAGNYGAVSRGTDLGKGLQK